MHVKIESEGHGKGKVFIDGKEMNGVISVCAYLGVRDLTTVTIELLAEKVELDLKEAVIEEKRVSHE